MPGNDPGRLDTVLLTVENARTAYFNGPIGGELRHHTGHIMARGEVDYDGIQSTTTSSQIRNEGSGLIWTRPSTPGTGMFGCRARAGEEQPVTIW